MFQSLIKTLQRAITLTELVPSPYFSIINVHLVDINVLGKFFEIPSLPFQDIEKPKHRGRMDNVKTVCPPPNPHPPPHPRGYN